MTHFITPSPFPKDHRHVFSPSFLNWRPIYLLCERLSVVLLVSLDISSTSKPQNYSREDTTTRPLAQVYSDQLEKGILCIGQLHPTSRVLTGRLCGRRFLRHEEYTFPTAIFAVHMPKLHIFQCGFALLLWGPGEALFSLPGSCY